MPISLRETIMQNGTNSELWCTIQHFHLLVIRGFKFNHILFPFFMYIKYIVLVYYGSWIVVCSKIRECLSYLI